MALACASGTSFLNTVRGRGRKAHQLQKNVGCMVWKSGRGTSFLNTAGAEGSERAQGELHGLERPAVRGELLSQACRRLPCTSRPSRRMTSPPNPRPPTLLRLRHKLLADGVHLRQLGGVHDACRGWSHVAFPFLRICQACLGSWIGIAGLHVQAGLQACRLHCRL